MKPDTNKILRAGKLAQSGIESFAECGKIIVEVIDAAEDKEEIVDAICDLIPHFRPETVRIFERIGRGILHPEIAICSTPGTNRLARLPMDQQEKYLREPVQLLIESGETLKADVRNLTASQAAQVFDGKKIRSLAEQRLYVEGLKSANGKPAPAKLEWEVKRGELRVYTPCTFTLTDWGRINLQMVG